ncbi:hypothetical protein AB4851_22390 [Burkholderia sp. 22PA0099]|uniref:hypothetical protein n=1 Tax=Burkholderia sp. 22PA0099 TaxID=3237372 RepID=UPI0039C47743
MRKNSGSGPVDLILGEQVAEAVKEAVHDDPNAYGIADGEEAEALKALSMTLSAIDEFGNQIAVLVRAERGTRDVLRSSGVFPGVDRVLIA